jgi:hypothetical protein
LNISTSSRYVPVAAIRKRKKPAGRAVNPSHAASGVQGSVTPIRTISNVVADNAALGLLLSSQMAAVLK